MDRVLAYLQRRHTEDWGDLLDAGTGESSLHWVSSLPVRSWTAVTADPARAEGLRQRYGPGVVLGNWQDPQLLADRRYDVVLADYLLGACERYAPHFQGQLLERLVARCRGWLYLVGMEPWPAGREPLHQIAGLRDAVQLLLGRRPHRELPQRWVERELARLGQKVAWSERFETTYDEDFARRELMAVEANLEDLDDRGLAQVLRRRCHALGQGFQSVRYGFDYLLAVRVSAEPPAAVDPPPG